MQMKFLILFGVLCACFLDNGEVKGHYLGRGCPRPCRGHMVRCWADPCAKASCRSPRLCVPCYCGGCHHTCEYPPRD